MEKRNFLHAGIASQLLATLILMLVSTGAHAAINLNFDADVSPELKAQVTDDLTFMAGITATKTSPLHQEIFGATDGANYLQWFDKRVLNFGVDTCGGDSAVACQMSKYKHKIFVTNHYIKDGYPQIARLMTLYHEARHTEDENNNWPHARCPLFGAPRSIWTGRSLNGSRACDSTAYGSYGSASILLNNIAKFCENCSEKTKADAKLYSDDQIKRLTYTKAYNAVKQDFAF